MPMKKRYCKGMHGTLCGDNQGLRVGTQKNLEGIVYSIIIHSFGEHLLSTWVGAEVDSRDLWLYEIQSQGP